LESLLVSEKVVLCQELIEQPHQFFVCHGLHTKRRLMLLLFFINECLIKAIVVRNIYYKI
jgi:hypothetical protein